MTSDTPADASQPLRIKLPDDLEEQTLRSTLDRSLQLMARDLIDLCGGLLEDQFGADWHFYVVPNGKPYEAPDPLYWFNLLKGTTSPAYDALGARPGQLDLQLHRMRQIRNELFHFAFDYKVLRTQQHLGQLRDLAHRCRLPCKADIETARRRLELLRAGKVTPPPTAQEVLQALALIEKLELERDQAARQREEKENELEKLLEAFQAEKLAHEQALADAVAEHAAERSEQSDRLRAFKEQMALLEDEIADRKRREEAYASSLAEADPPAQPLLAEPIEAAGRAFLTVAVGLAQLARASSEVAALSDHLAAMDQSRDQVSALVSDLPAPELRNGSRRQHLRDLEDGLVVAVQQLDAAEDYAHGLGHDDAKEVRASLAPIRDGVSAARELIEQVSPLIEEPSAEPESVPLRERVPPGSEWTWPPGDDVWFLSLRHKRLRRPRSSEVGEFGERFGADIETSLVEGWLTVSPEGGRVHIDEDGDACMLNRDGHYVYLGRVPDSHSLPSQATSNPASS